MKRNLINLFFRNFLKNPGFSLIRLLSMSVGITAVVWVALYIFYQVSFDKFHVNGERIFRAGLTFHTEGKNEGASEEFVAAFAPDAAAAFPEIESFCRVASSTVSIINTSENEVFKLSNVLYVDSSFLTVFSFKLLEGDPSTALSQPYSIVLTKDEADRLFPSTHRVGRQVRLNDSVSCQITGVIENANTRSGIQYESLVSFSTLYKDTSNYMGWDGGNRYTSYFLLGNKDQAASLEEKFPEFMQEKINAELEVYGSRIDVSLQPLQKVHLHHEQDSKNTRTNLYVLGIIGTMILVISAINFINLTISQAPSRMKEVGVLKTLGASRKNLIFQFIGETGLNVLMASLIAALLLLATYPLFTRITDTGLVIDRQVLGLSGIFFVLFFVICTVLAGIYPALYMSSLVSGRVLKYESHKQGNYRQALIIFQFFVAIVLLSGTLIMNRQLDFLKSKPTGVKKEGLVVLPLNDNKDKADALKSLLSRDPGVESVSGVSEIPYNGLTRNGYKAEGTDNVIMIHQLDADENLLETFGLSMVSGEFFSSQKPGNSGGVVINETLAKQLGWENPLGKILERDGRKRVIGVVKDFHFASLHEKVRPLVITREPNPYDYLAVRYRGDVSEAVGKIQGVWKQVMSDRFFEYWFLDEAFGRLYKDEARFRLIMEVFSGLAMVLAISGLLGLVSLNLQGRIKEIGVRKVLGASSFSILKMLNLAYLKAILIAVVVAVPVVIWIMRKWLQGFAYQAGMSSWTLFLSVGIILVITLLTVSLRTLRAATANPVKALRTE